MRTLAARFSAGGGGGVGLGDRLHGYTPHLASWPFGAVGVGLGDKTLVWNGMVMVLNAS